MLKIKVLPLALLLIGQQAFAQQTPINSGQMQQLPLIPKPQPVIPQLPRPAQGTVAGQVKDQTTLVVKQLRIEGTQVYSEDELIQVTGFAANTELNLEQLREMTTRISSFYHRHGYFVAQAYLPAQDIRGGIVKIMVLEGHYGKIQVKNNSNVSDNLLTEYKGDLREDSVITAAPLETSLLLLSDLPGIKLNSVISPGAQVGDSDLTIDITQGNRLSGSVDADNAGNRYTGEYRFGVTLNYNEPFGLGDVASLRALTSGEGLRYARASYQMQFGKLRTGIAYSDLEYKLGKEFESLGAHGYTKVASIFASYPLIRSRNQNLYGQLGYDDKTFRDYVDSVATVTDKKSQLTTATLYGDMHDQSGTGAQTFYSVSLSAGNLDLQTPVIRNFDASTSQRNGHFGKLNFNVARVQGLTDSFSLYAVLNGQFANKNLDVSEKMELGGMYAVRAYPEGEAFADQGLLGTLELRYLLPSTFQTSSQLQLLAFVDAGYVDINKNPWLSGVNHRSLSGAGVGLIWSDYDNFVVKAYYAGKLGNESAISAPDKSGRFWIQAIKYF